MGIQRFRSSIESLLYDLGFSITNYKQTRWRADGIRVSDCGIAAHTAGIHTLNCNYEVKWSNELAGQSSCPLHQAAGYILQYQWYCSVWHMLLSLRYLFHSALCSPSPHFTISSSGEWLPLLCRLRLSQFLLQRCEERPLYNSSTLNVQSFKILNFLSPCKQCVKQSKQLAKQ